MTTSNLPTQKTHSFKGALASVAALAITEFGEITKLSFGLTIVVNQQDGNAYKRGPVWASIRLTPEQFVPLGLSVMESSLNTPNQKIPREYMDIAGISVTESGSKGNTIEFVADGFRADKFRMLNGAGLKPQKIYDIAGLQAGSIKVVQDELLELELEETEEAQEQPIAPTPAGESAVGLVNMLHNLGKTKQPAPEVVMAGQKTSEAPWDN